MIVKLRNKKTGEIAEFNYVGGIETGWCDELTEFQQYHSIKEFNEDWEDYEEPKKHWTLDGYGYPMIMKDGEFGTNTERDKEIGNYFETKEEAEKAVEKLKAWKRLKDKRFDKVFNLEFSDALCGGKTVEFKLLIDDKDLIEDIKLLFGGEE